MITYGHGDEAFVYLSNKFWPNDLSFKIRFLLWLFRTLEKEPIIKSKIIFAHEPQNAFFQKLMHGGSHCLAALKVLKNFTSVKPLLKKLFFQMDNCVKDNKNYHLLDFMSFLSARKVFEEVQLIIGHNHEDIDGSFGYLLKNLREWDNYVLVDLLKAFMNSQDHPFILQIIQEILC
jgi:hypothetical protein